MLRIIAIIIGVAVILVLGRFYFLGKDSQAGTAPGLVDGALAPCPEAPNCVSSEAGVDADHAVEALPLAAWDGAPAAIEALGGAIVAQDEGYIAATFSSGVFKFVDDVELRRADDAVHVRSASRVGYSDLGVNRKRVDALREKLSG